MEWEDRNSVLITESEMNTFVYLLWFIEYGYIYKYSVHGYSIK